MNLTGLNKTVISFFLLWCIFGFFGLNIPLYADSSPIKIGVLIPLTGPSAHAGKEMLNGYKTALEKIKNDGWIIGGREVELKIVDTQGNTATAIGGLEKLMTRDKVEIILGTISSTVIKSLSGPLKKYKPVFGCTGGNASELESIYAEADWFFHYHPWDYDNMQILASSLSEIGGKGNIIIAHEEGVWGTGAALMCKEILEPLGFKVTKSLAFKSASTDLSSVISQAKNASGDYYVWFLYPVDSITMVTQMKELNYSPKLTVGIIPGWPENFSKLPEGEYIGAMGMWSPDLPEKISKDFVDLYTKVSNEKPRSYWAPIAYVSLITMADAIDKAKSTEKGKIIAALQQGEWQTPLGKLRFHKSKGGLQNHGFEKQIILQWLNGKQEIVWPNELATHKIVYPVPTWDERKTQ